jgi:hypothetical protein
VGRGDLLACARVFRRLGADHQFRRIHGFWHPSRRRRDAEAAGARFRRQSSRRHPGGRALARVDRRRRRQRDQAEQLYAGRVHARRGMRVGALLCPCGRWAWVDRPLTLLPPPG